MQKNQITDRSKYARIRVDTKTRTPSARTVWMMTVSTEAEGLTQITICYRQRKNNFQTNRSHDC